MNYPGYISHMAYITLLWLNSNLSASNKYNNNGKWKGTYVYYENDTILNKDSTCYKSISSFKINAEK